MLDYNSIVKKRNEVISLCNEEHLCIHIDATALADGTNAWIHDLEDELRATQAKLIEAANDPNQSSEEPKAKFCLGRQTWCI